MILFFKKPLGIIVAIISIGVLIGIILLITRDEEPAYDSIVAAKQTIVQEVSVSGNVQPAESVDLAFEKTGTVDLLLVDIGQKVEAGKLLAQLDNTDAQKEVRDAEVALESARVELEKIILEQQQQLRGDTLNKNYEDGLATLDNLYDEFEPMLEDLDNIFFGTEVSGSGQDNIVYYTDPTGQSSVVPRLKMLYGQTEQLHNQSLTTYLMAERGGTDQIRLQAIEAGYNLAVQAAETIKTGRDAIRYYQDNILTDSTVHARQSIIDTHTSNLTTYASSMDTYVEDLLAITNAINNQEDTLSNYPLDISSQELTIKQKENDLAEAKNNLEKYSITAPMEAVVTRKDLTIGEVVAANSSVITIISESQFEIEANIPEADITKVQVQNSAAITLDAYGPDLVFQAAVTEVDPAETIIEGVTTYRTVLQFTQDDSRIKSGMTADIVISTAQKEQVIAIPQRAIIRQGGNKFVRVVRQGTIEQVQVETGLRGSDGTIEIVSGVSEGDQVITFFPE